MGIDLLDLAFRLERQFAVRVSPEQFSKLAMRNDPPDIRVGDLFDLLRGEAPQFGVLDLELDADTLWPIYQRAVSDALGVDLEEVLLVLVIGTMLGWLVRVVRIQRDAVGAIQQVGAWVEYDWERVNGIYIPGRTPWASRWLVELVGVDYFGTVAAVQLSPRATDEAIVDVARLGGIAELSH